MRKNLTREQKKSIIDFFTKEKNVHVATMLFNTKWNTQYNMRTLQQVYSNYMLGFDDGIMKGGEGIAMQRLAQRELAIMAQQKQNAILRKEAVKAAKKLASREIFIAEVSKAAKMKLPAAKTIDTTKPSGKILCELVIADIQYKGNEFEHVRKIFAKLAEQVSNISAAYQNVEFRIVTLGDDIEGAMAHMDAQVAENNTTVVKQVTELSKLYIEGINKLYSLVDRTKHTVSLVLLPWSNHGMMLGEGKKRYQFPDEDMGLLIREWVIGSIPEDIYVYPIDDTRFVIETEDSIYTHGHQGFMKNKEKLHVLGVDKDIKQGHLHHYEEKQERNRVIYSFGTCRSTLQSYERLAGYSGIVPEIAVVLSYPDGSRSVVRIKLC